MDQNFHDVELFFCFCRLSAFFPSLLFYFSFLFIFIHFLIIFLLIDLQACMHQYALLIFLSPHILITPIFATFFSLCTDACLKFFFSLYTCMVLFVYMCMLGAVLVRTFLFLFLFFFFLLSFFFFDGTLQ